MQIVEINNKTAKLCLEVPRLKNMPATEPLSHITATISRVGGKVFAEYGAINGGSGKICFFIDDSTRSQKPGRYSMTVYHCKKPVHTLNLQIPRHRYGAISTQDFTHDATPSLICKENKCESCEKPKDYCKC